MPDEELRDIDQIELSLTGTPATKEGFIMVKKDKTDEEKEKEKEEAKDRFAKFSELDDDARYAAFLKLAKDKDEEEEEEEDEEEEDGKKKKKAPDFNFDKADEPTKIALRAIGEAILNVSGVDVPAPVAEFAKSIKAKLAVNGQPNAADMIAFAKSNMPGLVEAIQEPLKKELGDVTKTVEELQSDKDLAAMKVLAAELPGDLEIVAKRLMVFQKSMTEADFNAYIEEQKGLKTQVSKSALLERQSSGVPSTGSAEALIMGKAKEVMSKKEGGVETLSDAIEFVGKSDPVLWGQYQEEIRNRPALLRTS